MSDGEKTREQLLEELAELRRVIASHESGEKLRESEETVRALLNAPINLTLLVELDGTIITLNELAAGALGSTVAELIGRNVYRVVPAETAEARRPFFEEVARTGKPVRNIDQRQGRWYDYTIYPVLAETGDKVARFAIYSHDITEERGIEEALRTSEVTARALLNAPHDLALLVEPDGTIVTVNEQAAGRFGTTVQEMQGKNVFQFFPDDVSEQRKLFGVEVQRTGQPVRNIDQRGGRWFDYTIYPIKDISGKEVVRFAIFARDITEQREMETALRESEEKYRTLVEQTQQGIVVYSKGRFVFVNSAAAAMHGRSIEELMAMDPEELQDTIHSVDQEPLSNWLATIQSGGEAPSTNEFRFVRKDGAVRWVRVSASVVQFEGEPAVQGIVIDIDEQKKLEQRIIQAAKLEAIGRLAGGVAHDFNNLLTAILGYSKSLARKMDPADPLHESATEIGFAAERASALTRQLLMFGRKQAMKPELFNLNSIVHGMWNMLSSLINANIQVILRLTPGLGKVKADAGQLEQVLMNLVLNARDAMEEGGSLTIETSRVRMDAEALRDNPEAMPGTYVLLAIRDTGAGLDEKQQRYIFEPFFSTKGLGEGTGLGLSVVYGIVQQHGGVISVESERDQGSCFCVYLPLAGEEPPPPVEEPRTSLETSSGRLQVLVVEDEHVVRRFIVSVLREFGFDVAEAESAEEVKVSHGHRLGSFNLVLADIMLPGRSGIHLVKDLTAVNPDLAVVMTSGYAVKESELNYVRVSNHQYLEKPFTDEELMAKVRRALRASGQTEGPVVSPR